MTLTDRRRALSIALVTLAVAMLVSLLAAPAHAAEIRLTEDGFDPDVVRVEAGTDVVWINASEGEQTIIGEDGTWDSGPLRTGETFSVALRDVGTVRYATADGSAEGRIIVRAAADTDDADDTDDTDDEVEESVALPTTGLPSVALVGLAVLLFGAGAMVLRRVGGLRA